MKFTWLAICLAVLHALPAAESGQPTSRPNIVMLMVDTLRADHLGCYGYARATSPRLDELAAQGVRCERMIASASWTLPSIMSIFTGVPPSLHGVVDARRSLRPGLSTLASELRKAGYQTAGITANPMTHSKHGFAQGFDVYDDFSIPLAAGAIGSDEENPVLSATAAAVSRFGLTWLERQRHPGVPFFLYLHYYDPHAFYAPPPPYDRQFADPAYRGTQDGIIYSTSANAPRPDPADLAHLIALYDGEIAYTDAQIGRLLDGLGQQGLTDNTLVILISDHGEEFYDHGGTLHGSTLYDELIHVPCILRWPGQFPPATHLAQQMSHADLLPTLLAAAGLEIPAQVQGHSQLTVLRGLPAEVQRSETFSETRANGGLLCSLRTNSFKLIWDVEADTMQAFDLANDPGEKSDLSALKPKWLTPLHLKLQAWATLSRLRDLDTPAADLPAMDPATAELLRSMGYFH